MEKTRVPVMHEEHDDGITVTDIPDMTLLGRTATKLMGVSVDKVLRSIQACQAAFDHLKFDVKLRINCEKLCKDFPYL